MNLSALIAALNSDAREALEDAAGACVSRGGYEIGIEDYVEKLLKHREVQNILTHYERSADRLQELLEKGKLRSSHNKQHSGRPVFSPLLIEFLQEAYLLSSLEMHHDQITPGILILNLLRNPARYSVMPFMQELSPIPADELQRLLEGLYHNATSTASSQPSASTENALQKYTTDFTEDARNGKIDAVFARGPEIRQMVDILTRRRKNNPILVGDPGVGKTAVVEGLALKVAQDDVPDALKGVRIVGLDMGRLQAGASVKGEFEKRLKAIIDEVKASPVPTILFIDEAHTLVGSGNAAGSGDGANLLKPALARGELRTIAATTWSEYKKYFEKDAALARRFQLVKLDEPSPEETVTILRGIVPHYEKSHSVYIRDDAVIRVAELSSRYISGRYLPDKAIDVLDTACARVRVSLGAKPARLENMEENLASMKRQLNAIERDACKGVVQENPAQTTTTHASLQAECAKLSEEIAALTTKWQKELALVRKLIDLRQQEHNTLAVDESSPNQAPVKASDAETTASEPASPAEPSTDVSEAETAVPTKEDLQKQQADIAAELVTLQGDDPLVFYEVNPSLVAGIVAEWTGIPLGKLSTGEADNLNALGSHLRQRIRGQDHAIAAIEKAVLAVKTGLDNPNTPSGIFLLVGPSGVGKTETALAVADALYGGERMLISINMSEFQEKHTVSRLIGSPPGYVGYGEGGRLTEAVRRQPYSPVLFDEIEKAHPDVINLFYQVFDKGVLADGEGREIDFKNTMIFLTSNLGSDIIAALCEDGETPDPQVMHEALRPALSQFFKPALLGRMTIVPYGLISPRILEELVVMKLQTVADRLDAKHHMPLEWSPAVVSSIAASCTAVDTGARNIDHIINATLLPGIATTILGSLSKNSVTPPTLFIDLNQETSSFTYTLRKNG